MVVYFNLMRMLTMTVTIPPLPLYFFVESSGTNFLLIGTIYWHEINKRDRGIRFGRSHEKYI
jgi:hypothetical protein